MIRTLRSLTLLSFIILGLSSCNDTVRVSPEMQGFIDNLDGSPHDVEHALHEFGADNLLDDESLTSSDLCEPKVISCTGDKDHSCYEFEARAGKKKKVYEVCWDGKKIESMHATEVARQ